MAKVVRSFGLRPGTSQTLDREAERAGMARSEYVDQVLQAHFRTADEKVVEALKAAAVSTAALTSIVIAALGILLA
jgi:hypothetical protein